MRVLIIEDDKKTAAHLEHGLGENGHSVDCAGEGHEGLRMAQDGGYDILIVDRMLPGVDGLTIVDKLRRNGDETPILFLSALGHVDERVRGLKTGGDDYLAKPFSFSELLARVEALARRRDADQVKTRLVVGDLELDVISHDVKRDGVPIILKHREFRLLEYLMRNAGRVVTRTMLLEHVWNYHFDPRTNVIDVHVSRLRGKIDKEFPTPLLHTVRGVGYKLACLGSPD